ncbi:MAG: hypothetical protein ACLFUA_14105 [Spirochaetales bacterium]
MSLSVDPHNAAARLYRRLGFLPVEDPPRLLPGDDGVVMVLALEQRRE